MNKTNKVFAVSPASEEIEGVQSNKKWMAQLQFRCFFKGFFDARFFLGVPTKNLVFHECVLGVFKLPPILDDFHRMDVL